jgi:hypothetical protein
VVVELGLQDGLDALARGRADRQGAPARQAGIAVALGEVEIAAAMRSWLNPASNFSRSTSLILRMAFLFAGILAPEKIGEDSQTVDKTSARRASIPLDSDRRFRTVTADSGPSPKSVTFSPNRRSRCSGILGHVRPESAVTLVRNMQIGRAGPGQLDPTCADAQCRPDGRN